MAKIATIIFSFTYLTRWLSYTTQSLFQAIEKVLPAIIISLGFSLIFPLALIPCLYSLNLNGFWLNLHLYSLLAGILSLIFILIYKKIIEKRKK